MGETSDSSAAYSAAVASTLGEKKANSQGELAELVRFCIPTHVVGQNDIYTVVDTLRRSPASVTVAGVVAIVGSVLVLLGAAFGFLAVLTLPNSQAGTPVAQLCALHGRGNYGFLLWPRHPWDLQWCRRASAQKLGAHLRARLVGYNCGDMRFHSRFPYIHSFSSSTKCAHVDEHSDLRPRKYRARLRVAASHCRVVVNTFQPQDNRHSVCRAWN